MGKKGRRNRNKNATQARDTSVPSRPNHVQSQEIPVSDPRSSLTESDLQALVTDNLLETVLSRGVDDSINSKQKLREYFYHLVSGEGVRHITLPLLDGLEHGPPFINQAVGGFQGMDDPFPLIIWASQWKLLNKWGDLSIGDELVDMVLKAGANVNQLLKNKTNALFFAVKYASPETVDLLLNAGVNVQQRDHFGRTCWYNALERPSPVIVRRLLDYLPVSETFETAKLDGSSYRQTTADRIVELCIMRSPLISWLNLGPPSASDLVESLLLLRQKGARFSRGTIDFLSTFFRTDMVLEQDRVNSPELFVEVAKSLVGAKIPEGFVLKPPEGIAESNADGEDASSGSLCSICQESVRKKVTLYCSHSFCRTCIINYGKQLNGSRCPLCRDQLCSDLHRRKNTKPTLDQMLGIENSAQHGPAFMTNDQVVAEARFQGVYFASSSHMALRRKLQEEMEKGRAIAKHGKMRDFWLISGCEDVEEDLSNTTRKIGVNLSVGMGLITATEIQMCPKKGPVCVEVTINDIPVLARVSNRSLYTIIGESVAEQLGLKKIEKLRSEKFIDVHFGSKLVGLDITCLEPFVLKLGEIEITLRNAIQASPDPHGEMFGIQLGQDFLHSGIWCTIDVDTEVDVKSDVGSLVDSLEHESEDSFCRVDGELGWLMSEKSTETLRYYSHDGMFVHVPLLHFYPFERTILMDISLKDNVKFDQCFWCCRVFPRGMVVCPTCYEAGQTVTYCDERCQNAAWKIHQRTHSAHQDSG